MIDVPNKPVYQTENIEIDAARRAVRRCGEEQYLRQQTFQVLLYLLEQRERLVTKDELIDNIWQGTAVTDNALVQCIMDIRRALGDDSHHPRFIKTFPKLGYRFVGRVEEVHPYTHGSIEIEEVTAVQIEFEKQINTPEKEVWDHKDARRGVPFGIHVSQPLRLALTVSATVIVVLIFSAFLSQRFSGSDRNRAEVALPQLPGRISLAVMHFENRSHSTELDWLREGMADMLITNLSRSPKLTVLSRQQLHLLLERMEHDSSDAISLDEALGVARHSGAEVILLGSFARLADKVRIEAQLFDVKSARLIAGEALVMDRPEQILDQVDLLSWTLAARLDATPGDKDSQRDLTSVMTDNLEAYRYYSLALEKAQALHNKDAIALLEKALALDPRFAMAHARIGYAYSVTWGLAEKGKPHLERAFKLSDRLSEKDKLNITAWYAIAKLDYPGAIGIFRQILREYPGEIEAYFRLGRLLQGEERDEEALEVARLGLVNDREAKDLHNLIGALYSEFGRHGDAIAAHQRYVALAPGEPNAHDSLGLSYQWAGRYAEAIEEYERALALDPEFEIAVIHLGNTYFQQGRYREAVTQYRRYIQIASSDPERSRGYGCIAHAQRGKGDLALAEQAARMELRYEKTNTWNSMVLALERDNATAAEGFKKQFLAEQPYTERGSRPTLRYLHRFRGYLDLKMGRMAEAIEEFKEALRHRPLLWNIDSFEDCLARAYLEVGQLDEAVAEYQRIVRLNPNYPLAHYHLAQAFERKGDHDRARTSYERFLQIWREADADLPQVVAARNYLALPS